MITNNIYQQIGETLIAKPKFKITVPIADPKRSLWDYLLRKPVITERTFTIYPCKVGNMFRIASRAITLPKELAQGSLSEVLMPLFSEHLTTIIYVVAASIQNNKQEPSKELIEFIKNEMDHDDLYECMQHALENLGLESFLNSIVLARGTIIILKPKETSPIDGSELIASHIQE